MIRKLLTCTVVGLVLAAGAAVPTAQATTGGGGPKPGTSPHATWKPPTGAAFNYPVGSHAARTVLVRRVIAAINHTLGGETIRIAAYSFDRTDVMNALLAAHRRGVRVQIVLNDNWFSPPDLPPAPGVRAQPQPQELRGVLPAGPAAVARATST